MVQKTALTPYTKNLALVRVEFHFTLFFLNTLVIKITLEDLTIAISMNSQVYNSVAREQPNIGD